MEDPHVLHVERDVCLLSAASDHHLDFQLASLDLGLMLPGLSSSRHCSRRDCERRMSVLSTSDVHKPSLPNELRDVFPGIATGVDGLFQISYLRVCLDFSTLVWPACGFTGGGRIVGSALPAE